MQGLLVLRLGDVTLDTRPADLVILNPDRIGNGNRDIVKNLSRAATDRQGHLPDSSGEILRRRSPDKVGRAPQNDNKMYPLSQLRHHH